MPALFRKLCSFGIVSCFMLLTVCSTRQNLAAQSSSVQPTLRELVRQSGLIFEGRVAKIESVPAKSGQVGALRVTFHVEQAILGVREGQLLEVREWAGLWNFGERYRVGERVFLFLYPASKLGLTGPVGGTTGRFNVGSDKQVLLDSPHAGAIRALRSGDFTQSTAQVSVREFVRAIRSEVAEQSRGRNVR